MAKPEKIILTRDDTVKDLLGHVASEDADAITFVIPKSSALAEDDGVFKKLAKVATAMGKEVKIESVDDIILAAAKAAGIYAVNPFFDNDSPSPWQNDVADEKDEKTPQDDDDEDPLAGGAIYATPVVNKIRPQVKPKPVYRPKIQRVEDDDEDDDIVPVRRGIMSRNKWITLAVILIVLVPSYWIAFSVLPRATIAIVTEKKPWKYNGLLTIEKNGPVPSSVITERKNAQMTFPALGKKVVSNKATGKIIVYNAYSSEAQQLVATTRFITADGKIIRLAKNVLIPGAKIDGGKITPSSIEADVVADKPGPAYNIGPLTHLFIPGFKGTAKYAGFYGDIPKALTGGFTGEAAYPTDADIKNAKAKIAGVLDKTLMAAVRAKAGVDYKLVLGATSLSVVKTDVNPQVNAKNEFSLFAEAEMKSVVFKESDLIGYFAAQMKADTDKGFNKDYVFKETTVTYDVPFGKIDFTAGKMSATVDVRGVAELPVDLDEVRKKVVGKSASELKAVLFALPGIESIQVKLWPLYVRHVPNDLSSKKVVFSVE